MALTLALGVAGCAGQPSASSSELGGTGTSVEAAADSGTDLSSSDGQAQTVSYSDADLDDTWDASTASQIILTDGSARFDGVGAAVRGTTVTITLAGTYVVSGTVRDGQLVVDLEEDGTVKLVLSGANLTCSTGAPIYVKNAGKVIITLAEGTENYVTDGDSFVLESSEAGEPNAAVFSKSDLTINGTGSLTVQASYNNGIASKDDLKIVSGTITVHAANDACKGRDCIGVRDGLITLIAGGDGLQSTNGEDAAKGYISIEGGSLDITAGTDGIQAQTTLLVLAGDIKLSTGGGSANSSSGGRSGDAWGQWGQGQEGQMSGGATEDTDSTSAKGLKAAVSVYVAGGVINIDSSDDSIHSNNAVRIDGGTIVLTSGDDGVHADATLEVNGGDLSVTKSYEGLESGVMTINGGAMRVVAGDDAVNVAGGVDESSVSGRPGRNEFTVNENNQLYINGGYIVLDGNGDGLDCNGRVFMTGGTVLINGPTSNGNGAMDYLGECTVSGGYLVAVGSSGMAQAPTMTSTQYSLMVNFDSVQSAGTLVHVEDGDGNDLLTFSPTEEYQSVVLCSPDITAGSTLKVYLGGSSTGTVTDCLYSGGTYTPGTEYTILTVSGLVTSVGEGGGMMPGGGMGGGGMPGGGMPGTGGGRPGH